MKQAADIRAAPRFIAHSERRLSQRFRRKRTEECYCIKEIRFTDSIAARNASEWPKSYVHADEVLETGDFQASEH